MTLLELKQKKILGSKLKNKVSLNHEHRMFTKKNYKLLSGAKSVEELILLLNTYWDYFNYTLLESIVDDYGSKKLQLSMKNYVSDLQGFLQRTTVAEYIASQNCLPPVITNPKKFVKIKSLIKKSVKDIKLYEVEQYRLRFAQGTELQEFALIFYKLVNGSLEITWLLDKRLVPQVKSAPWNGELATVLEEFHVKEVLVDGESMYCNTSMLTQSMSPEEVPDYYGK